MNQRKEQHARIAHRLIEKVSRHIGQPTVICPKCDRLVSPPERLTVTPPASYIHGQFAYIN